MPPLQRCCFTCGQRPRSKERGVFDGPIGTYIDGAGVATPTANGIAHYSKDGIHIVPARP
ncbi:polymorphic toxin type 50 domain-containing protein [Pseudomonas sp. AMR01]|uniref:polymorphic toxin type 50 domain-containing protein n=1 Tax=Pseudomonas sp. AMR01 TaxID=3064904 RepID=UPI0035BFFFA4